ncbi:unnamed protein product [Schistosoma turkestanicum]|nr:unnamed protein product [Schistosoma turkestanicum]
MTVRTIFEGDIYLITCQRINWEKQVQLAIERTEQLLINDDQLQERSTNQTTEEVQQSTDTKPSSIKGECLDETEQTNIRNTISFHESVTEAGTSLADGFNLQNNDLSPNTKKNAFYSVKKSRLVTYYIHFIYALYTNFRHNYSST